MGWDELGELIYTFYTLLVLPRVAVARKLWLARNLLALGQFLVLQPARLIFMNIVGVNTADSNADQRMTCGHTRKRRRNSGVGEANRHFSGQPSSTL